MSYYVYVLYGFERGNFYIGLTKNLKRRIQEHQAGQTYSTKRYGKLELIFSECFISEVDARRREGYLKTTKGRKGLRLILEDTLELKVCPVVPRTKSKIGSGLK